MKYDDDILKMANDTKAQLAPYCERIEITRIIKGKTLALCRIEVMAILKPYTLISKPYNVGVFESGIEAVLNQWSKVWGELPCGYMQRMLPGLIKLDLLFVKHDKWDSVFALRFRKAEY